MRQQNEYSDSADINVPCTNYLTLPSLFSLTNYILGLLMTQSCGHAKAQQPCFGNETVFVGIHSVPIKLHHCYQVQSTKEIQM